MHAGQRAIFARFDDLPEQVGCRCLTTSTATCRSARAAGARDFLRWSQLSGRRWPRCKAVNRRSVKIQTKREQRCRKRNVYIKVTQNGLKHKHETMRLFKTGILPPAAYGHAGMGMCRSSIQHKRTMAADSCDRKNHYDTPTLSFWRDQ